ncbi:MAG: PAS domain S-box protein [Coleofasciculaceae cyanobacterium]
MDTILNKQAKLDKLQYKTENQTSEAKLMPSEILELLEDVVWSIDTQTGELLYLNSAVEVVYGRPVSDFLLNPNLRIEVIHPKDREQVRAKIEQLGETKSYDIDYRIVQPDGEIRLLRERARLVSDQKGKHSRLDVISTDTTKHKQLQGTWQRANQELTARLREKTEALEQVVEHLRQEMKQRQKVEAQLAKIETKWQTTQLSRKESLMYPSSDLTTILSADGTIEYSSPSIKSILGYSATELVGQPFLSYIAPQDQKTVARAMRNLLEAGEGITSEPIVFRYRCKDGSWCFLEASGSNLLAESSVSGIVLNFRNVTERFKVQEALRQSEVRFRAIFEAAALGIAISEPDGLLLKANPALQKMLGYSEQELRQRTFAHPDDVATDLQLYEQLLAGFIPSYQMEKRYFHKQGHLVWGRLTLSLVRDKASNPLFAVSMVEDITAAKQTEAELLRISKAVENTSDAISITDAMVSQLNYLNPAFCKMFGYTLSELKKLGGSALLFSGSNIWQEVFTTALKGYSWQGEVEMLSRSGVIKQIALRADAIRDTNGEVVGTVAIHTDITERKQAEADLRQAYHRAELLKYITTEIRSSLDAQHIFQTTVTQLGQTMQVNRCTVLLYCEAPQPRLPLVAEYLEPGYSSVQYYEMQVTGNPYIERVLAGEQAIASTDVYAESLLGDMQNQCQAMRIKSMLTIRTSYQGQPNGVVCLHQCDTYRDWSRSEIELLEAVAAQVGIALAQAHLLEKEKFTVAQLEERNKELELSEARANAKATELEQTLEELQLTQDQLIKTEKMSSLGLLVASVAHDLNNPLNCITNNIDFARVQTKDLLHVINLYRRNYPQPNETMQEELEQLEIDFLIEDLPKLVKSIEVGAERIQEIVKSLRNLSKVNETDMKEVDIHEGIDNTLLILGNRLKANRVRSDIQIVKEYGQLPKIECYGGQLNRVFMNLISNAIDALEERLALSLTVQGQTACPLPRIQISTETKDDRKVLIRVRDNGLGMTEDVKCKLFKAWITTKPVGKGTGLGLWISHKIVVEEHLGRLLCSSVPGQGTEFTIEIPIRRSHQKTA